MKPQINDSVRLTDESVNEYLCSGSIGTVVAVFNDPEEAYEIEFCDNDGVTVVQITLLSSQFEMAH